MILVIEPLDFKASAALGSTNWDISYSGGEIYYNQYKKYNIRFIYNFTKTEDHKESLNWNLCTR